MRDFTSTAHANDPPAQSDPPQASLPSIRRGRRLFHTIAMPRLSTPLAILVIWEIASRLGWIPAHILPAPSAVAATFGELAWSGRLEVHLLVSLKRAMAGLGIGVALGTIFALIGGLSRRGEIAVDPTMQILRTLPFLGVVPLFILWFGIGETTKIALIALATKTPIYLTLYGGIRAIDPKLIEAGESLGLNRLELISHVILPGALPAFFVGLRYALGVAVLALVAVEQINATSGIGYLINEARDFMRTDTIVVCLLVYSLLGLLSDGMVRFLERHSLAWRPAIPGVRP
jgi:sulfonate transport system permease protein